MKKSVLILAALLVASITVSAQRDDMYYRPSKKAHVDKAKKEVYTNDNDTYYDYTEEEVDSYNRHESLDNDTLYLGNGSGKSYSLKDEEYDDDEYYDGDFECSRRMARFHSPTINIYYGFGSPFAWSYYDYAWGWNCYYDPWFYDTYWGWHYPHYYGYYGWHHPYYYGWHHHHYWDYYPVYYSGRPYYSGWRGNGGRYYAGTSHRSRVGSAGGRIWTSGRNYRDASSNSANLSSGRHYNGSYQSSAKRKSSVSESANSSIRSFGSRRENNSGGSRTPNRSTTRGFHNSVTPSRSHSTNRSYGSGSHSFGHSRSMGGSLRSGGGSLGGGSRSFGGGGGGRRR